MSGTTGWKLARMVGAPGGRRAFITLAAVLLTACGTAPQAGEGEGAQAKGEGDGAAKTVLADVAELEGEEREAALLDCAKGEEPLLWYTTLIEDQLARPLADAFQERYPGLKVEISRTNSGGVIEKMVNESRAERIQSDIWSASEVQPLKKADVIEPYDFPTAQDYSDDLKDPEGQWVASNLYVFSPGYNTDVIPPNEAPQTFDDLLDPSLKGRMAWSTSSTSGWLGFVGHILDQRGEEEGMKYLEQLAQQDVAPLDVSARQVLDQVVAGEYAIGLQIFNHHTVISAEAGAPTDWIRMEPLMVNPAPTGLTAGASSPCGARLFMDYQLSEEGQSLFREAGYLPAHPEVPAKDESLIPEDAELDYVVMNPQHFDERREEWSAVVDRLFR